MKIKNFVLFFVMLIILFLNGCAATQLNTVRNPELYNVKFEKILVVAPFTDIGLRRQTENTFVAKFSSAGMDSLSSIEIIPPTKEYSNYELLNILDKYKIDGILTVALKDFWTTQTYVPKSSSTSGSANLYYNSLKYQSYTQEYGGYYISKPSVYFETRLLDRKSEQIAWIVTSTTSGNAFADYRNLSNSLATRIVKELTKENMLILASGEVAEKAATSQPKKEIKVQQGKNQHLNVKIEAEPRTGKAPLEVFFDASGSYASDGYITSYQWDFKDGNIGQGERISHIFSSGGTYRVELVITDNEGIQTTITKMILVQS